MFEQRFDPKVIVAIDFGTTYSGYAYAFVANREICGKTNWRGQPVPYVKAPTQLLEDAEQRVVAWGWEARHELALAMRRRQAERLRLHRRFKMDLHASTLRDERGPLLDLPAHGPLRAEKRPVVNLIVTYLEILKNTSLDELKEATSGHLRQEEILWCLTVPAIWTDEDKMWMRRAAIKAGLIQSHLADQARLVLVLEPEAAALHCVHADQRRALSELSLGTKFVVVDAGGGTVDITAHEVGEQGALRELTAGTGGPFGSTYVDEAFREWVSDLLGDSVFRAFREEEPIAYLEFMGSWERIKCDFDPCKPSGDSGELLIPVHRKLYDILRAQAPEALKRLSERQDGDEDYLHLSVAKMKQLFDVVIDKTKRLVKGILNRLPGKRADYLFLVGGFAGSNYLREQIHRSFATSVGRIVVPPNPGVAVVEGAVLYGLNPRQLTTRVARRSIGCRVSQPHRPGTDPDDKKVWSRRNNTWYCSGRFSPFVLVEDLVEVEKVVKHTFYPMEDDQTLVAFTFYATMSRSTVYIDEADVEPLGSLSAAVPVSEKQLDRSLEVEMRFGATEILVSVKTVRTGETLKTQLDFSKINLTLNSRT